jgi:hypothetical protein
MSSEPIPVLLSSDLSASEIRQDYRSYELFFRVVGLLYYLLGVFWILLGPSLTLFAMSTNIYRRFSLTDSFVMAVMVLIGLVFIRVGYGCRHFCDWVKIPLVMLSLLGCLAFSFYGIITNAPILYLLWTPKGKFLFTKEYQEILKETRKD